MTVIHIYRLLIYNYGDARWNHSSIFRKENIQYFPVQVNVFPAVESLSTTLMLFFNYLFYAEFFLFLYMFTRLQNHCKETLWRTEKFKQLVYCCSINLYIFWPVVCHILWSIKHTLIDGYRIRLHINLKVTIYQKLTMIISYNTINSSQKPGTQSCTSDEDLKEYFHTVYNSPYICIGNRWRLISNDILQIWT